VTLEEHKRAFFREMFKKYGIPAPLNVNIAQEAFDYKLRNNIIDSTMWGMEYENLPEGADFELRMEILIHDKG